MARRTPRYYIRVLAGQSTVYQILLTPGDPVQAYIDPIPDPLMTVEDIKVVLNWTAVDLTAQAITNSDEALYTVLRKDLNDPEGVFEVLATNVTDLTFTDSTVQPEGAYEYQIIAGDKFGEFGDTTPPQAEGTLVANMPVYGYQVFENQNDYVAGNITAFTDTSVTLEWDAFAIDADAAVNPDTDPITYRILRSTEGGVFEEVASGLTDLTYVDSALVTDTLYDYKIIAVDQFGNQSVAQPDGTFELVTLLTDGSEPFVRQPLTDFTSETQQDGSILLTWGAVVGSLEYVVERRIAGSVDPLVEIYRGTDTQYIDDNVVADTTYEYAIYAEEIEGAYVSPFSAIHEFDLPMGTFTYDISAQTDVADAPATADDFYGVNDGQFKLYYRGTAIDPIVDEENWMEVPRDGVVEDESLPALPNGYTYLYNDGPQIIIQPNNSFASTRWAFVKMI